MAKEHPRYPGTYRSSLWLTPEAKAVLEKYGRGLSEAANKILPRYQTIMNNEPLPEFTGAEWALLIEALVESAICPDPGLMAREVLETAAIHRVDATRLVEVIEGLTIGQLLVLAERVSQDQIKLASNEEQP